LNTRRRKERRSGKVNALIELAAIMESVHTVKGTELFNQKKNFRE